jgi:homoserine kinase
MRIRVPATSANLGPGFDAFGMALQFYNHFEAHPAEAMAVTLAPGTCVETGDMSLDPGENLLAKAYTAYFGFRGVPLIAAALAIEAHIPLSRGMGSSSTAIVGGLMLADLMHPEPLGRDALLPWAIALEGHPDNVVPALLGGVRCCFDDGPAFTLAWPEDWGILLVIPPTPLSTHEARAIMPQHYSAADAVETLRGAAAWAYALSQKDSALFARAITCDRLHEPARGKLIPEYPVLKVLLQQTDAMGCVISGSGSTLAIYTSDPTVQEAVKTRLKNEAQLAHCRIISVKPDTTGTILH